MGNKKSIGALSGSFLDLLAKPSFEDIKKVGKIR